MNFRMKNSYLIRRSSAMDILDSHIAGWALPNPSESWPSLGILSSSRGIEKVIKEREVQSRRPTKNRERYYLQRRKMEDEPVEGVKYGFYKLSRVVEASAVE